MFLLPLYSSHHILQQYSIVHPRPYLLLWMIPESIGFNIILTALLIHPYLGLAIACGYPLTVPQAGLIFGSIYMGSSTHK
jgi:hypothetical protein